MLLFFHSIPMNYDLSCCAYLAIKFLRIVLYLYNEGLFTVVEFKIVWYSPRVPAGAVSSEGHDALGDFFTIRSRNNHFLVKWDIFLISPFFTIVVISIHHFVDTSNHDVQYWIYQDGHDLDLFAGFKSLGSCRPNKEDFRLIREIQNKRAVFSDFDAVNPFFKRQFWSDLSHSLAITMVILWNADW